MTHLDLCTVHYQGIIHEMLRDMKDIVLSLTNIWPNYAFTCNFHLF